MNLSKLKLEVISSDISLLNAGLYRTKKSFIVNKVEKKGSLAWYIKFLNKEKIDVLMIGSEHDVSFFSKNKEIIENKVVESHSTKNMTDSQLITALISSELDKNLSLKDALKNVVEQKLLGTYQIALMEMKNPKQLYFVKNSGDFFLGVNKTSTEIIVSTDFEVLKEANFG